MHNPESRIASGRRSHAAHAERDFLHTLVATDLPQARRAQRRIDTAPGQPLPVADAHEITHAELTTAERDALFGAFYAPFAETAAMELAS